MVRGAAVLPHSAGKAVRVAVFAEGDAADAARAAGADVVGGAPGARPVSGDEGWRGGRGLRASARTLVTHTTAPAATLARWLQALVTP